MYPTSRLTGEAVAVEAMIYMPSNAPMLANTHFFGHWGLVSQYVLNTSSGNRTEQTLKQGCPFARACPVGIRSRNCSISHNNHWGRN